MILSTHIMQEVQAICNRAIIINKGVIVADDTVDALRNTSADTSIINATFKETVEIALIKTSRCYSCKAYWKQSIYYSIQRQCRYAGTAFSFCS